MKKVLCVLITLLASFGFVLGQNNGQQSIIDSYEAGRRVIAEIVAAHNLGATIKGHAYAGYFFGNSWAILKKGDASYEVFVGSQKNEMTKTLNFDLADKVLSSLFSWTDHPEALIYNISDTKYTPFYYYYILYDENHLIKMELNVYTVNAYKKAYRSKKDRKILPFTKEQSEFIWNVLSVEK